MALGDAIDYRDPLHHLSTRVRMAPTLRETLIDLPRERWPETRGFDGEAAFWLDIHRYLLAESASLPDLCRSLTSDERIADMTRPIAELRTVARQLVMHAHQHHHVEDHHFFPHFMRSHPELQRHLALLDGDHRVLADTLEAMRATADTLAALEPADRETVASRDRRRAAVERLHDVAVRFDTFFRRHIGDEEEICVPILLGPD